jgi:uncharacterized membrane protein YphA (DoxX/SURF4 family)
MKKVAVLLILFGSGLAAYGISGFSGELSTDTRLDPAQINGSFDWSIDERLDIVVGVISLSGGLLLRKNSKWPTI